MIRPKSMIVFACLVNTSINAAHGATPCAFGEEVAEKTTSTTIPIPGYNIASQVVHYVSLKSVDNELADVVVRSSVNLNGLKPIMPAVFQQQAQLPGSNCNDRYSSDGYHFRGTGGNNLAGGFNVQYQRWECASADVPCPTWREPFRFCRKDAKTKVGESSVKVNVSMVAHVQDGKIQVTTSSNATAPEISGPLAFVGGIIGNIVGGPLAALGGVAIGEKVGRDLEEQIKRATDRLVTFDIQDPAAKQEMRGIKFNLEAAEFDGVEPITLEATHKSTRPVRNSTACFVKQYIIKNAF